MSQMGNFSNLLIYQPLRRVGLPEETEEGEPLALNRCEGKGARRGGGGSPHAFHTLEPQGCGWAGWVLGLGTCF